MIYTYNIHRYTLIMHTYTMKVSEFTGLYKIFEDFMNNQCITHMIVGGCGQICDGGRLPLGRGCLYIYILKYLLFKQKRGV